jgi:hypothetical protein
MAWTEEDVKKIITNPIYIGMGPYSPTLTKEQWIKGAKKYIKDQGAEDFLTHLVDNLREAFEPGASPYGYKRVMPPKVSPSEVQTIPQEVKLVVDVDLQDGDKILLTNQNEAVGNGVRIIRLEVPNAK